MRKARHVNHTPAAHEHHAQFDQIPLAVQAEHVLVRIRVRDHSLPLTNGLYRAQLIPTHCRDFELQLLTRRAHARLELTRELVVPAVQEQ